MFFIKAVIINEIVTSIDWGCFYGDKHTHSEVCLYVCVRALEISQRETEGTKLTPESLM